LSGIKGQTTKIHLMMEIQQHAAGISAVLTCHMRWWCWSSLQSRNGLLSRDVPGRRKDHW
jgi:hypothetical protein